MATNEGTGIMCKEKGHSAADARGRCLCCGAQIVERERGVFAQYDEPTNAERADARAWYDKLLGVE